MNHLGHGKGAAWLIVLILCLLFLVLMAYAMGDSIPDNGWVIRGFR